MHAPSRNYISAHSSQYDADLKCLALEVVRDYSRHIYRPLTRAMSALHASNTSVRYGHHYLYLHRYGARGTGTAITYSAHKG